MYGRPPPPLRHIGHGITTIGSVEEMLQERDAQLDELKFHLLRAQVVKANEDKRRRDVNFSIGEYVFLKLKPYRQKSLSRKYNEKLSPHYYGPYKIIKKIGTTAYELALLNYSGIHPVFHISQFKLAKGNLKPILSPNNSLIL